MWNDEKNNLYPLLLIGCFEYSNLGGEKAYFFAFFSLIIIISDSSPFLLILSKEKKIWRAFVQSSSFTIRLKFEPIKARDMKCFQFSYLEKDDEERESHTISISDQSFNSTYTDYDLSKGSKRMANIPSFSQRSKKLREFKYGELKLATNSFSVSSKIGEGGFGSVYMGVIKSPHDPARSIDVAVKQLGKRGLQGHKEWVTEVNVLGVVDHPNLVKLVGYCEEDDEKGIQRLLVYEYMRNRSVENHLSNRSEVPLSWNMRLKVAQDAARGLTYLHEEMDFQIIFRDFKSSNILLDDEWNAKLSDFGLARVGPREGLNHVSTAVVGTVGYSAPEYIRTGHLTSKSDVWSYGVFLYELITGRRPLDRNRPKSEQKLLEWIKPYLDAKKFRLIIDPRLQGKYSLKTALKLSMIANKCLSRSPKTRPKMSEVLLMVSQLIEAPLEPISHGPPLKIMVPLAPSVEAVEPERFFVWSFKCKKTYEDMKNEGKRKSMEVKLGDSVWLSRIWTFKILRIC